MCGSASLSLGFLIVGVLNYYIMVNWFLCKGKECFWLLALCSRPFKRGGSTASSLEDRRVSRTDINMGIKGLWAGMGIQCGFHGTAWRGPEDPCPSCFPVAFALQEAAGGVVSCDVGATVKAHGYRAGCMVEQTTDFILHQAHETWPRANRGYRQGIGTSYWHTGGTVWTFSRLHMLRKPVKASFPFYRVAKWRITGAGLRLT